MGDQVTAPTPERRVGEARMPDERLEEILSCECLADADVEGEEILMLAEEAYTARALQRTDNSQVIARLTAEVERLTKEKAALHAIATEAVDCFEACHNFDGDPEEVGGWDGQIDKLRAALSLPTPAPEAKEQRPKCPGPDCVYCSGEACYPCLGRSRPFECDHATDERHPVRKAAPPAPEATE